MTTRQDTGADSEGRDEFAGQDLPAVSTEGPSLAKVPADTQGELERMRAEIHSLRNELARLRAILTTPGTEDFMRDVEIEAAHQIDRWGTAHDAGKEPADWFWLLGYLAGKALHDVRGKRAHHIIAAAAALLNWHRAVMGDSNHMRPGIEPPDESDNARMDAVDRLVEARGLNR